MPPRVLVDATAGPADRGGLSRYVDGLLPALAERSAPGTGGDLAVVCQRSEAERYRRMLDADVVAAPAGIGHRPARLVWEQTGLPLLARDVGAALIHSPYYTMPLQARMPVVVTIHDATVVSEPALHPPLRAGFYRAATRTAVHRAAQILVPSEATRDELVTLLDVDAGRITVARHGVDTAVFHPPTDAERARIAGRLGLRGRSYVAFLGELGRRKNVPTLVRAWVRAVADLPDAPVLVLAGSAGWDDELETALAEVPPRLRVLQPGFLHAADLAGLLGGAEVVVHPGAAEGFALPVLEALACGAPVLATRRRAVPEVGGDAVAYVEPDVAALARGLRALLTDPARRAALAAGGPGRAAQFTWAASAQVHLGAYAAAVASASASA